MWTENDKNRHYQAEPDKLIAPTADITRNIHVVLIVGYVANNYVKVP